MTKEDLSANNGQGRCGRCTTHAQCISAQRCVKEAFPALGELPVHDNAKPADPERFASHCPAHDSRCAPDACVLDTIGAGRPLGIRGEDAPRPEFVTNLGEWVPSSALEPSRYDGDERLDGRTPGMLSGVRLPSSEVGAKQAAWLRESQLRIDAHNELQAKRAFRMRKFSTLTDAEVKEVMAYDLTPRARKALNKTNATVAQAQTLKPSDLILMNALAGDGLELPAGKIEQMLPPAVPEVTSPAFKLGVFCGLLVGSGVASALPYIVELLK